MKRYVKTFESFNESEKESFEIISTPQGDVVVSNEEIPTDAKYITIEENPRRYVIYSKHISGTLGNNPKLIKATILPYKIEGIPSIE